MSLVTIKFAPAYCMMINDSAIDSVREDLAAGKYVEESLSFNVEGKGVDACEEAFDLTNNPSREQERLRVYGHGHSMSTGDIVFVDGEQWVCMSFGWAQLNVEEMTA